ncbi:GntR family transcriptional regulator [Herbidospora sp. NBRC 101105]|uniref:GntR family transcriptional regulator n=1 Tax=Herbidospora sp. NBRC 101105 TaxID=3032195 RepID=UPI0024A545F3|nr:GntR family transcriptional regulator [Herbidospora sp. NBRC 101105]GLX96765.1 GntR family transcriptional regulator [Herbidospora sp. NBRC 101105]
MGKEFQPPKYAQVMTAIQERIESGVYGPGETLPSETELVRELGVGRTTVVRALQTLAMQGWITREHGRGSFVKGRPQSPADQVRPGLTVADEIEAAAADINVQRLAASRPVARLLGIAERTPVVARRRIMMQGDRPSSLQTMWFPLELALGTDLERVDPLRMGVRQHLQAIKRVRVDHVVERLAARKPSKEESELLETTAPVLAVLASVHDPSGTPLFAMSVVLPGDLHELQDVYQVD